MRDRILDVLSSFISRGPEKLRSTNRYDTKDAEESRNDEIMKFVALLLLFTRVWTALS